MRSREQRGVDDRAAGGQCRREACAASGNRAGRVDCHHRAIARRQQPHRRRHGESRTGGAGAVPGGAIGQEAERT